MTLSDRIARGVKASFGAHLLRVLSNGILIVVLTRYLLTPAEYGLLFFGLSVVSIVAIFGTLGLPSSLGRYVAEYTESAPGQVPHILSVSLGVILALSLSVGLLTSLLSPVIAQQLGEPALAPLLALSVLYLVGNGLVKYLTSAFQGLNQVQYSALVNSVSQGVRVIAAIGLVVLGFGVVGAFLGYLIGFAIATAVGGVVLYRRFYAPGERASARESDLLRRILEYSVPLTATRGASVLDKKVDTVLVGVLLSPTAVSFYTVSKQVADVAITPATSLGFTISPALGEQKAGDQAERAARLYEQSMQYILLLYVPALVGLVLVADPLVRHVFGPDYLGAVPVLQVLSIYVTERAITKITSDGLDFLGRARDRATIKSAMAVTNFGLNLLLIPAYGVVGAAVATVMTYSVYTGVNVAIIGQELPIRFAVAGRTLAGVTLVSEIMGLAVYLLRPFITGVPSLLGVILAGIALWGILSTAGGLLDVRRVVTLLS